MLRARSFFILLLLPFLLTLMHDAYGQEKGFRIDYTVKISSVPNRLFHVTADIHNAKESNLELSLPTWTPGWYTIENYTKNMLRFVATDEKGAPLRHSMVRKQTWRIENGSHSNFKVEFDYDAEILALNQAKIADDFAFFTGTELFLMAAGHRDSPSTVRFEIPDGWNLISAMKQIGPREFEAPDYDTLVDCPTEMGKFDVTEFSVEGKPHFFVATPAGKFTKDRAKSFTGMLAKIAEAESGIMAGLPYDKYVYFYFFSRPESNAAGALEHLNSHVAFTGQGNAPLERMAGTAAHEFFHLWNVKRIRPIEMWPYDYSRENETPSLWVSEGFTNYYGNLSTYRAGLIDPKHFLETVGDAAAGVEGNEARKYISPAESSVSTWIGYDSAISFAISYYTQGQNLGALLDLSIRHDTEGAFSLDDVMRSLYREFYQKGKGFSEEDLIGQINRITGGDYHRFFRRYVEGVEVPDYDTILGYAGYKTDRSSSKSPDLGIDISVTPEGLRITRVGPETAAGSAGLMAGDIIVSIDGLEVTRRLGELGEHLTQQIGKSIKLDINRSGRSKTIEMVLPGRAETRYSLVEVDNPTAAQMAVRNGWLKRKE